MISPNHAPRRDGLRPELVVLHYTQMTSAAAAQARLCDPAAEVSAHYLIARDGRVIALVPEHLRAWHAGAGEWQGRGDVNSRSIGIELDNDGASPFAAPMMRALEDLLAGILARHDIPPRGVIAHSDLAPGRKIDPGARFDWRRLACRGLAVWPFYPGNAQVPLALSLDRIGYPRVDPALRLAVFRLRFRPGVTGAETPQDRALAESVARATGEQG
jgi:N-acetylmuramoyl-L-alanine amidase